MGQIVWDKNIARTNRFYKKTSYASEKISKNLLSKSFLSKNPKIEKFLFPLIKQWVLFYVFFSVDYDAAGIFFAISVRRLLKLAMKLEFQKIQHWPWKI